jgi:nucleotide-binding universal stress UspA family protein
MNAKKILCPVDFSTNDEAALATAASLARDTGATVVILHVEEPPLAYGAGHLYYGDPDPTRDDLREMLEAVKPGDPGVPYEHRLTTGDPANAIVREAEAEKVDFVVMSTHGRTGLGRLLMGSVAEAVVRRANCPVLTVKQPQPEPARSK